MITKFVFFFFVFSSIILTNGQLSNINSTAAQEVLKLAFNLPDNRPASFNIRRATFDLK